MTGSTRLTLLGATLALVGLASPVAAQDRVDVDIEYQVQRLFASGDGFNLPLGLNVDVAGRIAGHVSAVGQVDWSRKSESASVPGASASADLNLTTFGGGIRWGSTATPSVAPFLQALLGATRVGASASVTGLGEFSAATTNTMVQIGGGIAFPFSEHVGGVAQFDYRRIFDEGGGVNSIRGAFGIRWLLK